jgi:hypothetical protein
MTTVREYRERRRAQREADGIPELDPKEVERLLSKASAIFISKKKPVQGSEENTKPKK